MENCRSDPSRYLVAYHLRIAVLIDVLLLLICGGDAANAQTFFICDANRANTGLLLVSASLTMAYIVKRRPMPHTA